MSFPGHERLLLLSIHDVSPRFEGAVDRLRDHLGRHTSPERLALLVVPNHWGEAPVIAGSAFAHRLRSWSEAGAEIFVHGWHHRDTCDHSKALTRIRAAHMTAGEGEFLSLDRTAASSLMSRGKAVIEDIIGRSVAGFVAPAWLYGSGALEALEECGFALAEDHWKVWQPTSGRVLSRNPVLTWASRSTTRIAASLLAARALAPLLGLASVARVGVHPGDTGVPALMTSIDCTVARLARSHRIGRYAHLVSLEQSLCAF